MSEQATSSEFEQKLSVVNEWVRTLSEEDRLEPIDRSLLRDVLKAYGADFNLNESERASLGGYTNKERGFSMRKIWGNGYDLFKGWTEEYVQSWEESRGTKLPSIRQKSMKEPGKILVFKNSGMLQLFGAWTALAGLDDEEYSFDEAKRLTEARARNGRAWAEGRKGDRERVKVPTSDKPILLSSFPPGFPDEAWGFISTQL